MLIRVGQVTGEEKYDVLMSNIFIIWFNSSEGIVYCDFLRGSIFGIVYLYRSYNQMISVSNDCRGRSNCCVVAEFVVYWFQSHSSLILEMVIR